MQTTFYNGNTAVQSQGWASKNKISAKLKYMFPSTSADDKKVRSGWRALGYTEIIRLLSKKVPLSRLSAFLLCGDT